MSNTSVLTPDVAAVIQGSVLGGGVAATWSFGRILEAGKESLEVPSTITNTVILGRILANQIANVLDKARLVPLGFGGAIALLGLHVAWAYAYAYIERNHPTMLDIVVKLTRLLRPLTYAAVAATVVLSALAGHWFYVASFFIMCGMKMATEKGWLAAKWGQITDYCLLGLNLVNFFDQGEWLTIAIMLLASGMSLFSKVKASRITQGPPAVWAADNGAHIRALMAVTDRGLYERHRAEIVAHLTIDPLVMQANYHGALERPEGSLAPEEWSTFQWPEWLSGEQLTEDEQTEWHDQMVGALNEQSQSIDFNNRPSIQECWESFRTKIQKGLEKIRNNQSNGGTLETWVPLENAVQFILHKVATAASPDEKREVRAALREMVARLDLCGSGLDRSLLDVSVAMTGSIPLAARILRRAAEVREQVVNEQIRQVLDGGGFTAKFLRLTYGENGVHLNNDLALARSDLNLPGLAPAIRDCVATSSDSGLSQVVLKWRLNLANVWDVGKLLDGVHLADYDQPLTSTWITERGRDHDSECAANLVVDPNELAKQAEALCMAALIDVGLLAPKADFAEFCQSLVADAAAHSA